MPSPSKAGYLPKRRYETPSFNYTTFLGFLSRVYFLETENATRLLWKLQVD